MIWVKLWFIHFLNIKIFLQCGWFCNGFWQVTISSRFIEKNILGWFQFNKLISWIQFLIDPQSNKSDYGLVCDDLNWLQVLIDLFVWTNSFNISNYFFSRKRSFLYHFIEELDLHVCTCNVRWEEDSVYPAKQEIAWFRGGNTRKARDERKPPCPPSSPRLVSSSAHPSLFHVMHLSLLLSLALWDVSTPCLFFNFGWNSLLSWNGQNHRAVPVFTFREVPPFFFSWIVINCCVSCFLGAVCGTLFCELLHVVTSCCSRWSTRPYMRSNFRDKGKW